MKNTILLQNIRSIYKYLNHFEVFLAQQETQPLAICLTETWLKDDSNIKCLSRSSYQLLDTSKRQIRKGRGVAKFVREGVVKTVLQKFSRRNCQLLTIKIERKNCKNDLVLTVVYLKTNTSLSELPKTFEEYFEKMALKPKQMHLMCGDLNIDHSKTNAKFSTLEIVFGGYDLNNMSLTGFTRETINSQTRNGIVYCSQELKVEVLKSTITDHYTVKTELDEETKETGFKMQQYYRHWATLENNSVLEKIVFKLKHKLQEFQDIFCLSDCDSSFEKFQQTIIDEINYYVPEKKSKALRHKSWIDNSVKNLQQKSKNFIKDTCNRKQKIIKRELLELRICYRKECSKKGETFIKRF